MGKQNRNVIHRFSRIVWLMSFVVSAGVSMSSIGPNIRMISPVATAQTASNINSQPHSHSGLFRYPDVSRTHIAFMYANDLWLAPREGGAATPLIRRAGQESFPKFSPDGKTIAFMVNFDGNSDLYTIPVDGGVPMRITHHPTSERLCDWTTDGKLVFYASGFAGLSDVPQLFTVSAQGGLPAKLPVPYGIDGAVSADGQWLAYVPHGSDFINWKRYQGGEATDIWLFKLSEHSAKKITDWNGTDTLPMWHGDKIYYLSDAGAEHRLNLWSYDTATSRRKQITNFSKFDVKWPSIGPGPEGKGEIVFQYGAGLHLLDLPTGKTRSVEIGIPGDPPTISLRTIDASQYIANDNLSPDGRHAVIEARGDVWLLPISNGPPTNLTRTSGVAERRPAWSPDGRWIAYFADVTGEYELYLTESDGKGESKRLTHGGQVFSNNLIWSSDSRYIVFTSRTGNIFLHNLTSGETKLVDADPFSGGWNRVPEVSWSHNSQWLAYAKGCGQTPITAIWFYNVATGEKHQVTSGMFNDASPVFDRVGGYFYYKSARAFRPTAGDEINTFIYSGTQVLMAVPLATESAPIDITGFERRAVALPIPNGRFGALAINERGAILYSRLPLREGEAPALKLFDPRDDKKEEKSIVTGISDFAISADGKWVLVIHGSSLYLLDASNGSLVKQINTTGLTTTVNPREEWRQIFNEAWRSYRDFFYDQAMHDVDWRAVRTRYAKLLDNCANREDLNYVIGEMIGELNVSHATISLPGDVEQPPKTSVGLLGADFELHEGSYRITKIYDGAPWDADARSPLSRPGVNVKAGDYLLAVNGLPIDPRKDVWADFQGWADQLITITVSQKPILDNQAREVVVRPVSSEANLRYRAWIESSRAYVDQRTNGKAGYIYLPEFSADGLSELGRQYYGQMGREALIVDLRWNSGGMTPERFVEMLHRPLLNYWAVRYGFDTPVPIFNHRGQKCVLINSSTGSSGELFPYYFRRMGLGQLIGTRTWGGIIGSVSSPVFIDGGAMSIPHHAFYDTGGQWGIEGHGVDPDIEVIDDPALMVDGNDPQLDAAIEHLLQEIKHAPQSIPRRPPFPNRSGVRSDKP